VAVDGEGHGRDTAGTAPRSLRPARDVLQAAAVRSAHEQLRMLGHLLLALLPARALLAPASFGETEAWLWAASVVAASLASWVWRRSARRAAPARLRLGLAVLLTIAALVAAWPAAVSQANASAPAAGTVAGATAGTTISGVASIAASAAPSSDALPEALAWTLVAGLFAAAVAALVSPSLTAAGIASATPLVAAAFALPAAGWAAVGMAAWSAALAWTLAWRLRQRWRRLLVLTLENEARQRTIQAERDAALRADSDKSRFLAIASHDLRQPVHALGLFAATLHKRLHASPEEPLAKNLMRSVDNLERGFNAMLDISRLDGGAITPRRETFALRDIFRRLHMRYAGQAELAGLGLRFSTGGRSVTSDPQLLERIVGNLVHNAIRYTTRGGIIVVARGTATHVNIEVWDTGNGIAAADLPRIFEEFFQVGRGERDRSQGLGMGLAIVKRLAALLGHRLEVASTVGRGTMFRLGVLRGSLEGLDEETQAADTLPMSVDVAQMVLVVDDEEPIREGLRALLTEWGYQCMTAANAEEAERAVAALDGHVDLVLSDLHLGPGAGGSEVIATVRRLLARDVPAILVTGDTAGDALREVVAGTDPILFKPVQPRQLFEAMRAALQ
jgi:signal transduction histidine kinase/ActR/RegA family two-component response regulator